MNKQHIHVIHNENNNAQKVGLTSEIICDRNKIKAS